MSSKLKCYPMEMIISHTRVAQPRVLPKRDDGMPRLMLFVRVYSPKGKMACYTRRCPTFYALQGRDDMPRQM